MPLTQAQIDAIDTALAANLARGADFVKIGDRSVKYMDAKSLSEAKQAEQADLNAETYGACVPIEFMSVTG